MQSRDLFFGLLLVSGAGWIVASTGPGAAGVWFLVAAVGCGLAGVTYLLAGADAGAGRRIAGRSLTRTRLRAVAQALIGLSVGVIGVVGAAGGDAASGALAAVALVVLALAGLRWRRGGVDAAGGDGTGEA